MDSITTSISVHLDGHEFAPEVQTLVTDSGRPFTMLKAGPVVFYVSRDQLWRLHAALNEFFGVFDADAADSLEAEEEEDPIPYDDPAWSDEGLWTPTGAIHAEDGPDAPDEVLTRMAAYWESLAADGIARLPAISGGCDDFPATFEPSEADWADYAAHCRTADYLDGFNATRPD